MPRRGPLSALISYETRSAHSDHVSSKTIRNSDWNKNVANFGLEAAEGGPRNQSPMLELTYNDSRMNS